MSPSSVLTSCHFKDTSLRWEEERKERKEPGKEEGENKEQRSEKCYNESQQNFPLLINKWD